MGSTPRPAASGERHWLAAAVISDARLRESKMSVTDYGAYLLQEDGNFVFLDGGLLRVHRRLD
jgi:hypothetical protein